MSKIAREQAARGWTDGRLAGVAGVHAATIGRLLSGQTQRMETVKAVADALGLDLSELVIVAPDKERVA